jgi:hypothetical protein
MHKGYKEMKEMIGFKKKELYGFSEKELPTKLEPAKVKGKDTRKGRFVIVYSDESEKQKYMDLLGIDGKKVIYTIGEMRF